MPQNRLELILSAQDRELRSGLRGAEQQVRGFGSSVKGIMQAVGPLLGPAAFAGLATSLFEAGKAADELRKKLAASFGTERAEELLRVVQELGTTPPFTAQQFTEAAQALERFGAFSEETLIGVGDLAAEKGRDIVQTAELIGRAMSGNAEAFSELRNQLNITATSVDDVRAAMEGAAGSMDRMSTAGDELQGKLELLKQQAGEDLKTAFDDLAESVLPVINKMIELKKAQREAEEQGRVFEQQMGQHLGGVGEALGGYVDRLLTPEAQDVLGERAKEVQKATEEIAAWQRQGAELATEAWTQWQADVRDAIFENKREQLAALDEVLEYHELTADQRTQAERKRVSLARDAAKEEAAEAARAAADQAARDEQAAADAEALRKQDLADALHAIRAAEAAETMSADQKVAALRRVLGEHTLTIEERRSLELELARTVVQAEEEKASAAEQAEDKRKRLVEERKQREEQAAREAESNAQKLLALEIERLTLAKNATDDLQEKLGYEEQIIALRSQQSASDTDSPEVQAKREEVTRARIDAARKDTAEKVRAEEEKRTKELEKQTKELEKQKSTAESMADKLSGGFQSLSEFLEENHERGGFSGLGGLSDPQMKDPLGLGGMKSQLNAAQGLDDSGVRHTTGATGGLPGAGSGASGMDGYASQIIGLLRQIAQALGASTAGGGGGTFMDPVTTLSLNGEKATGTP